AAAGVAAAGAGAGGDPGRLRRAAGGRPGAPAAHLPGAVRRHPAGLDPALAAARPEAGAFAGPDRGAWPKRRTALRGQPSGALLALGGWLLSRGLRMEEDLRRFLPSPRTPAQVLLVDELGEGPGSRLLLLALSGADDGTLAAHSRALVVELAARPGIALVANG